MVRLADSVRTLGPRISTGNYRCMDYSIF